MSSAQLCWVYKSLKVSDLFVYFSEEGKFDLLPDNLKARVGELRFVLKMEITPEKKLAKEDAQKVLESLRERGYHLQMPDQFNPKLYFGD